jgi:hypothetical protein
VACYYRNPQNISYFDKELFFEAIHKNPDIHYQALKINRQFWKNENKVLRG